MQPADLNMATDVIGHSLFLFVTFGDAGGDEELAQALDFLSQGLDNMHQADGPPSDEAFEQGRFQLLRAEDGLASEQQIAHPEISGSHGLIRLECATLAPLKTYETGLRALFASRGGLGGNLGRSDETPQLHQPRHDSICLRPCPAAWSGRDVPIGGGDPDE